MKTKHFFIALGVVAGIVAVGLIVWLIILPMFAEPENTGYHNTEFKTVLDGITATTTQYTEVAFNVTPYTHCIIQVGTAASADMTMKAKGSIESVKPTFASAQSYTNAWDYIEMVDLEDGSSLDGDTGLALSGTDDYRLFEVNVNGLRWLTFPITDYIAGTSTAKIRCFDNL